MSKPQQTFPCQLRRLKYDEFPNSHMLEDIINALALRCVDIVKQLDRTPVRGLLFSIKRPTLQEGVHCDGMVVPVKVSMVSDACDVEIRSLRVFVPSGLYTLGFTVNDDQPFAGGWIPRNLIPTGRRPIRREQDSSLPHQRVWGICRIRTI